MAKSVKSMKIVFCCCDVVANDTVKQVETDSEFSCLALLLDAWWEKKLMVLCHLVMEKSSLITLYID